MRLEESCSFRRRSGRARRWVGWLAVILVGFSLGSGMGTWAQSAQEAGVLFYDDFQNPQSGWRTGPVRDSEGRLSRLAYQDGEFIFVLGEKWSNCWAWAPISASLPANFRVETTCRIVSGTADIGFVIGSGDPDHYRFGLSLDGQSWVYRVSSGEITSLLQHAGSRLLSGGGSHLLALVVQGRDAAFIIDEQTVLTYQLPASNLPYKVGLAAGSASGAGGNVDVRYDDFAVWPAIPHNNPPLASFAWQVLSSGGSRLVVEPRTGDKIRFDASGSSDPDGRITNYAWDWESDGTHDVASSVATAEHMFSASGSHRVTLRVTDDKGATAEVTKTIGIGVRQTPQASFSFAPSQPSIVDEVRFTDASTDPDGQVSSWSWEFGDGTTSAERSPTHTYAKRATFTVKLTVTDNDGLTGTKSQALTVVNLPPEVSFTFEPQTPVVGQSVRFDGSASKDRDGTIQSCTWEFDGDSKAGATGAAVTYVFTSAGEHTVTLTMVDNDGATAQHPEPITVAAAPQGPPRFAQQWAVVIGVGDYEDPTIPDLTYTEADAQAFYGFLTSPQGGGFQKDHVRFLLNEQATSTAVKGAFSWLIDQADIDDLVVVYFAGHGGTAKDTSRPPDEADGVDEYLVTYDARTADLFSTAVRDDEMADWLASFQSDHVVVILDSCFASGATRSLEQTGTRAGPGNRVFNDLVGPGRLFLAASQEAELSYEDGALGHGVFTYYLLRGLGALNGTTTPEADADQDGRVTVEELRIYLECEVTRARPQQHPLVTGDLALTRVALDGYGEPLLGEVTALDGDRVIISLGTRHGVQPGDRFEVVGVYALPDGTTMRETRATIEVLFILGPDRSVCRIVEQSFPIEVHDVVTPAP